MFTIHHQPQLALWLREREKPQRLKAIMEKERTSEFLRQAKEKGYLKSPSRDYLLEWGCGRSTAESNKAQSLSDVHLLKLNSVRLVNLGQIQLLTHLQICILPGNYITSFAALANCPELTKLDLHSNQISTLPGPEFWCCLPKLRILHLHNNSIGKLDCLQPLGEALNLHVLTLYDTPISLKKMYRHHVVNSIWTLKALDFHVISDEEIIEDASFGGQFAAMNPAFRYTPMLVSRKDSTFEEEMSLVRQVLEDVSRIQAHHSPVLIVQKFTRGFLARRNHKLLFNTKIWAAVCIQRFYRQHAGLQWTKPQSPSLSHPQSPFPTHPKSPSLILPKPDPYPPPRSRRESPAVPTTIDDGATLAQIDYDTYLENRRPGSKTPSVGPVIDKRDRYQEESVGIASYAQDKDSTDLGIAPTRKRTNIHIDLTKLQSDAVFKSGEAAASGAIVFETSTGDSLAMPSKLSIPPVQSSKRLQDRAKLPKEKVKKEFKTVKQLLGPLPQSFLNREREDINFDDDDEYVATPFRLSGFKAIMHSVDLLQELLISRREVGHDIRCAHKDVIDKTLQEAKPKPVSLRLVNADQRLFARVQGTMGMSCLRAVQQAYRDRSKAEKLAATVSKVAHLRDKRDVARRQTRNFLDEKRLQAIRKKDDDSNAVIESVEKRCSCDAAVLEERREQYSKARHLSKTNARDKSFMIDFTGQHTSISNALMRHDHQTKEEMLLQGRRDHAEAGHDHNKRQLQLVSQYLEHRQMMRQAQITVERSAMGTRMLQEANERLAMARNRVTQQKQKCQSVHTFYPLPRTATDPVVPPVNQDGKPDRFETLVAMYEGRVGNHPAVFGK